VPASADAIPAPPAVAPAAEFALARGDEAMRQRDVVAARRFYEFAASAGVAGAATAVARTYDPIYLQQVGVRGVKADAEAALRWYKRASAEGAPAARPR
jgi:TPR repeat protein